MLNQSPFSSKENSIESLLQRTGSGWHGSLHDHVSFTNRGGFHLPNVTRSVYAISAMDRTDRPELHRTDQCRSPCETLQTCRHSESPDGSPQAAPCIKATNSGPGASRSSQRLELSGGEPPCRRSAVRASEHVRPTCDRSMVRHLDDRSQ